ncbi:hypothetical protein [Planctomyces sp. SH-PL62]|uniref:hypothetical protein n=1 Tax=Planctomyces sp. SH-PL62 TaxID=1636152 RepID=UPI00078E0F6D|nr:hypothetical protein [Planctomyces sp. SH-PL62]AMV40955.1 hypothetical protein VT85_26205 [Planctomyces sp. SH-PL62]
MIEKVFLVAVTFVLLGLFLVVLSWLVWMGRGLGSGRTVALDNVTLYSESYCPKGVPTQSSERVGDSSRKNGSPRRR